MATNQFLQRPRVKTRSTESINRKMRNWVLPYWYERQNNPLTIAYAAGDLKFHNVSYRNWTAFRMSNSGELLLVDRFGVIYLPDQRISIEIWVHTGEQFYTPDSFKKVLQKPLPDQGIETLCYYDNGVCIVRVIPDTYPSTGRISCNISLNNCLKDTLKQSAFYLVIRPYDYNGLSAIHRLEYRDNYLLVNNARVIFFDREPKHCYFTDGIHADVTKYFYFGEGNTSMPTPDGLGTGMIGFSGLPAELTEISLFFINKNKLFLKKDHYIADSRSVDVSECLNRIQTNTIIDQLLTANIKYLKTFYGPPYSVSIYQLLALNRFSDGSKSHYYLAECLKKVAWDGSFTAGYIEPAQLVWGVADYFKLTGDYRFVEKNWPALKRLGYALWHQEAKVRLLNDRVNTTGAQDGFYEKDLWLCAALKALEELAHSIGQLSEAQAYKEQNLALHSKITWLFESNFKYSGLRVIPLFHNNDHDAIYGAGIVRNLAASYPLQLWERGNGYIMDSLHFILDEYYYKGGVFSPLDFQGIDLALSARMGQVLIREGFDYTQTLKLLIAAAGGTWSLPDRIHPLTMNGIGENGHDPEVLYQLLLLIRNMFALEEGDCLELLPGLFDSSFWERPQLKINRLNTYFGEISYNCHNIGDRILIEFWPQYRVKPAKIHINLHPGLRPVYADGRLKHLGRLLEIDPDFHILHLKKLNSAGLS